MGKYHKSYSKKINDIKMNKKKMNKYSSIHAKYPSHIKQNRLRFLIKKSRSKVNRAMANKVRFMNIRKVC